MDFLIPGGGGVLRRLLYVPPPTTPPLPDQNVDVAPAAETPKLVALAR